MKMKLVNFKWKCKMWPLQYECMYLDKAMVVVGQSNTVPIYRED